MVFQAVLNRWREQLLDRLFEVSRGNVSTSTFHNTVDRFVAEALTQILRYDLNSMTAWVEKYVSLWPTAPADELAALNEMSVT